MNRAYFKPYPTPERPVPFNKMTGWFGTPPVNWRPAGKTEMVWCFMSEQDARQINHDDCAYIHKLAATTFPLPRLERLLTVRTEWSRK